ncbi:MAG: hypothetical protein R2854_18065 [Caldilineaceae bacterium]
MTETFTDAVDAKAIGPLLTALFRSAHPRGQAPTTRPPSAAAR